MIVFGGRAEWMGPIAVAAVCQRRVTATSASHPFCPLHFYRVQHHSPPSPNRDTESKGGTHDSMTDLGMVVGTGVQVFLCLSVLHRGNAALRNWGQAWHGKCQYVCVGPPLWRCMSCSRTAFLFFFTKVPFPHGGGRIPVMGLGANPPPFPMCSTVAGGESCVWG